jgi:hypothetical protein
MSAPSKKAREPRFTPWVVPLRRIFPWWYLVACVLTFAVTLLVDPAVSAAGAFWGPAIGVTIRDRQFTAYRRQGKGVALSRRDLTGPQWLEPLAATLLTILFVGISFALGFVFGGTPVALLWTGVSLMATSLVAFGIVLVALRARKRRRRIADRAANPSR